MSEPNSPLLSENYLYRFGGIARLYGMPALERFASSHVAIIGIGGVGSWAAEALARSGIGEMTLFDMDDICTSNINRQIHAMDPSVGKMKVDEMASRLIAINPEIIVHQDHSFVTPSNVQAKIDKRFDYVFDATDSVKAKVAIARHCTRNKIKIVSSGSAGGQIDPSKIEVKDLSQTIQDPLLAKVRTILRKDHGFPTNPKRRFRIDCVYSTEPVSLAPKTGEQTCAIPDKGPVKLDCSSGFGSITHITGSFGFAATSRILQKLAAL